MKHLSRFLCLLLMLALLLPGALAEAVEQTEQIDSGIEEDEVEKVGDIFDMYQVGSMVEANGKLYTISYGPTICEFDGENWRIAVVASSFSDVLRFSEDGSFTATKRPPCCLWLRMARCCCSTPTPTA
ncbi:MAG: hypothetical protein ACLTXW_16255 [Christensenellales bacterium]